MPNLDLKNTKFKINDDDIKDYFGGNDTATYEYMNKVKSELENKQSKTKKDNKTFNWIKNELDKEIEANDNPKRVIMQTDGQGGKSGGNAYKDTHNKDKSKNPTKVRMPKIHKGGVGKQIMTNKVQYETINKELNSIKYLIEYMDNK